MIQGGVNLNQHHIHALSHSALGSAEVRSEFGDDIGSSRGSEITGHILAPPTHIVAIPPGLKVAGRREYTNVICKYLKLNGKEIIQIITSFLLGLLFYRNLIYRFSDKEKEEYNKLYEDALNQNGFIRYECSYPKHRFLQYLSISKNVLFHGSNNKEINEFYPRHQTLYNGKYVDAVFSTSDGIWPIFYAVFNRSKLIGNFRNGCFESKNNNRFYFFSLSVETINNNPWTDGMVYILPRESFNKVGKGPIIFDEWISKEPIKPILRIAVDTRDFVYYNKVSIHRSQEALLKTWIFYKFRTVFVSKSKRTDNIR